MSDLGQYKEPGLTFLHTVDHRPKQSDFDLHAHDKYEIYYFLGGGGTYLVEGNEYRLRPGCLVLMRDSETHKLLVDPTKPYERMTIHVSPDVLASIDPDGVLRRVFLDRPLGQKNYYDHTVFSSEFVFHNFKNMEAFGDDPVVTRAAILSGVQAILFELYRSFRRWQNEPVPPRRELSGEMIDYINRHLYEIESLEQITRQFFISKSQSNRIFKQATGTTIWEYITLKRLISARNLIRGGQTALEASSICGFQDYSAFYRAYKKRFSVSPGEDRFGRQGEISEESKG